MMYRILNGLIFHLSYQIYQPNFPHAENKFIWDYIVIDLEWSLECNHRDLDIILKKKIRFYHNKNIRLRHASAPELWTLNSSPIWVVITLLFFKRIIASNSHTTPHCTVLHCHDLDKMLNDITQHYMHPASSFYMKATNIYKKYPMHCYLLFVQ